MADAHGVIADGAGGAFITWRDLRTNALTETDVYGQRLTSAGTVASGWLTGGVPVCVVSRPQEQTSIAADGQGGMLLAWMDLRNGGTGGTSHDIYVQRIRGDGSLAPGWSVNGVPATRAPYSQLFPSIARDGAGGAYVVWQEWRNYSTHGLDVYAQHLTAGGEVAGGWPLDGLPVCTLANDQYPPFGILPDEAGGVVLVWGHDRTGAFDTYAQHLLADGTIAPGWTPNGVPLILGRTRAQVAPDGAGGFYLGSSIVDAVYYYDTEYYVQRFTFAGTRTPGWPPNGVRVCGAPGARFGLQVVPDVQGGLLLAWYDYRPSPTGSSEIYALRVMPDGSLAAGWTVDGVRVSDDTAPGNEFDPSLAPDGLGGVYVAWESPTDYEQPAYVQHLTAGGAVAPGWARYGVRLAPTTSQFDPQVVQDGTGGAIVVWDEADQANRRFGLYAQRFRSDGPVAALVSLVSAQAEPDAVRLVWLVADAISFRATVERRSDGSGWQPLGAVTADGSGRIEYEDRAVTPGERYAYRLAYTEDGLARHSAEAWVDVPRGLALTLEGLRPNPAVGDLTVSFTLPSAAPARLELIDLSGRRLVDRDVESLGAGRHLLRLGESAQIAPGMYWLRLTQGGRALTARVSVVR